MNFFYKLAKKHYLNKQYKEAQDVISLEEKRRQKEHNDRVLEDWKQTKKEDNLRNILDQHEKDRLKTQNPEHGTELTHLAPKVDAAPDARRWDVYLIYADVDENGRPIISYEDGIREKITVSTEELEKLKKEDEKGYIEILEANPMFPSK